jgi:serine/threonine-protein kinase
MGDRRSSDGFAEETRAYLQARLRLTFRVFALVVLIALVILVAVETILEGSLSEGVDGILLSFPGPIFAGMAVLAAALAVVARRARLSARVLGALDLLFLQILFIALIVPYAMKPYFSEPTYPIIIPAFAAAILTRAVLVPSTAWRTLLGSATAPLAVLACNLAAGATRMSPSLRANIGDEVITFTDLRYSQGHFVGTTVLNQIILWWAVVVATLASQVNLGLRRRVHEAGRVGAYELGPLIGRGAMGEVYQATHALLKRPTAIKFLRPEITGSETLARFEREVRQTSRLSHPNAVAIFDYGRTAEGVFYYAMELLDGLTLREVVTRDGPQPAGRAISVLAAACGALNEAHGLGMVHRDVKPDNIMLCRKGGEHDVVKLLDFGLVKDLAGADTAMTIEGATLGTPETLAPEMIGSETVGPSADIYSLCAVGYHLLTGRTVFPYRTIGEHLDAHRHEQPEPPSRHAPVPADLEALILAGLAKVPGERPTATELRDALLACADAGGWGRGEAEAWWRRCGTPALS